MHCRNCSRPTRAKHSFAGRCRRCVLRALLERARRQIDAADVRASHGAWRTADDAAAESIRLIAAARQHLAYLQE